MKVSVKVTELTHDDLVTIIADAKGFCHSFIISFAIDDYQSIPETNRHGNCVEEMVADVLLAGKSISIYDTYSGNETYGNLPAVYDERMECMKYTVTLKDFLKGCSKSYERTSKLLNGEGDCIDAYNILQTIVLGEEIYG